MMPSQRFAIRVSKDKQVISQSHDIHLATGQSLANVVGIVWVDSSPHTQQLRGRWYPSCSMDGLWTAPVGLALILRSLLRLTFIIVGRRTHLSYGTAVLRYN
jgi:hypothetical protein